MKKFIWTDKKTKKLIELHRTHTTLQISVIMKTNVKTIRNRLFYLSKKNKPNPVEKSSQEIFIPGSNRYLNILGINER